MHHDFMVGHPPEAYNKLFLFFSFFFLFTKRHRDHQDVNGVTLSSISFFFRRPGLYKSGSIPDALDLKNRLKGR